MTADDDGTKYTVDGKPATVRDGRLVLTLDEEEAAAFRAWHVETVQRMFTSEAERRRQEARDDAFAIAEGAVVAVRGVGGDA